MRNWKALLCLIVVAGMVYANSLFAGFVWDDNSLIVQKQAFFSHPDDAFRILVLSDAPAGMKTPYYRPLNTLSYMLDHYLWGLHPFWYHLENLLLHLLVTALFYLLLAEVFANKRLAFFSALLFGVFPVNAEAVDAVFNRNTLFCALFSIVSLLLLAKGGRKWAAMSLLAYFLALLSKEPSVVLPFFLLSFSLVSRQNFKIDRRVLAGFFGVTALYFMIRRFVLGVFIAKTGLSFSIARLKLVSAVYFEHFRLFVFPFKLNALYTEHLISFSLFKAVTVFLGILLLLYFSLKRGVPVPVRAGAQWIFWELLPVSNAIKIPSAPVAERFQYMIVFGFVLILGYLIDRIYQKRAAVGTVAVAALCVAFGVRTFERNFVWKDDASLFSSMIRADPGNVIGRGDLAITYEKQGDLESAAREFRAALVSEPGDSDARTDLGVIYAEEGNMKKAVQEFKTALRFNSGFVQAYLDLGVAYAKEGRLDQAAREFGQATTVGPAVAQAHFDLAEIYEKEGRSREAAAEIQNVLRLDPKNMNALEYLGKIEGQAK